MTDRQKVFVDEYLIDMNATQAAIRAGYSPRSAYTEGPRLMDNVGVRAQIDQKLAERARRTGINQDRIVQELARVGLLDPLNLIDKETGEIKDSVTADDKAAIQSVKVRKVYGPDGTGIEREVRFADKLKALELLGKHLGMFTDKLKVEGATPVVIVDDLKD